MAGDCGTCTLCCKVFPIPETGKTGCATWCKHAKPGRGCGIYEDRPERCSGFACLWLTGTQELPEGLRPPLELRPDKCGVVLFQTTNECAMGAYTDPGRPTAWQEEPIVSQLYHLVLNKGVKVVVSWGPGTRKVLLERGDKPDTVTRRSIEMTPPDAAGLQHFRDGPAPDLRPAAPDDPFTFLGKLGILPK